MPAKQMTFDELAGQYCERQEQTPAGLLHVLHGQQRKYRPEGWMLLECAMLDSSRLGELVILPYGPRNTFKEKLADGQVISPRGLVSDMSVMIGYMPATDLPDCQDAQRST
jgi:hypothetical protein